MLYLQEPVHLELEEITGVFGEDYWGRFSEYVEAGLCNSSWNLQRQERRVHLGRALDEYATCRGFERQEGM